MDGFGMNVVSIYGRTIITNGLMYSRLLKGNCCCQYRCF